jgi:transposase
MSVQRFVSGPSREQAFLLPPDVREWLPEDHLAWVVIDAVGQLDLSGLCGAYRGDGNGRPAYDPALLVALLLYSYATGERSSRVIERRCHEDVAVRVICAGLFPDHATIARFRRRHAEALIGLFGQVLALCELAGLGRFGTIAIDGTKIRANASKYRYATERQAARILAEAEAQDAADDELDPDQQDALRGSGGAGGANERRARFERAARELAESEALEQAPIAAKASTEEKPKRGSTRSRQAAGRGRQPSPTDPESKIMKAASGSFVLGYNAQLAVSNDHLVVACDLTTDATDHAQLEPMIEAVRARTDRPRRRRIEFLADAGYWNGDTVERLQASGERVLVPPNGKPPRKPGGTSPAARMRTRLAKPEAASRYQRRQALAEPVIAHIKINRRLDRFLLRGTAGARLEWTLGCTAHNLTRLARAA